MSIKIKLTKKPNKKLEYMSTMNDYTETKWKWRCLFDREQLKYSRLRLNRSKGGNGKD